MGDTTSQGNIQAAPIHESHCCDSRRRHWQPLREPGLACQESSRRDGAAAARIKITSKFRRRSFLLEVLDHVRNSGAQQHNFHDESDDSEADTAGGEAF